MTVDEEINSTEAKVIRYATHMNGTECTPESLQAFEKAVRANQVARDKKEYAGRRAREIRENQLDLALMIEGVAHGLFKADKVEALDIDRLRGEIQARLESVGD